jgi:hypothetical protein
MMPRLSELQDKPPNAARGRQQVGEADPFGNLNLGTIRAVEAYPAPLGALYNGKPVTILATGDVSGMSPACQFVDNETGKLDWASADEFTIVSINGVNLQHHR